MDVAIAFGAGIDKGGWQCVGDGLHGFAFCGGGLCVRRYNFDNTRSPIYLWGRSSE